MTNFDDLAVPLAGDPQPDLRSAVRTADPPARRADDRPAPDEEPRPPASILIVDDRPDNLIALRAILEPLGERIVAATSADEALRSVLHENFAVILLDVRMPGTSGLETARLIKERERSRPTPIIFLTAFEEDRRRITAAYQSGAVDYLFKPLDAEILRAKVSVFVELCRRESEIAWQQRRRYADEVRRVKAEAERDRVSAVLDHIADPTSAYDHDWRWTYINPAAAELLRAIGKDPAAVLGKVVWEEVPALLEGKFYAEARRAEAEGTVVEFEEYLAPADRWFDTRVVPMAGGFIAHSRDVSERRRAELVLRVIARVGTALVMSVELDEMLQRLAEAVVPGLADWCLIDLVDLESRAVRRAAAAHADPGKAGILRDMLERYPPDLDRPTVGRRVAETGEPEVVVAVTEDMLRSTTSGADQARIVIGLGIKSYIVVPLHARGRLIGMIALVSARRNYDAEDLAVATDVANRAAVAIDQSQLYSAERRARTEAEEARARAEQASRAKTDFLATMSHELRTPLTAIIGYEELLSDGISGPISDGQREQLRRIKASSMHLLNLIDELLTFARFEAGRERVELGPVDVAAVLDEVQSITWPLAQAKKLELEVETPDTLPPIRGDHKKVRQILVNLVSNAVKFTDRGRVTVAARDEAEAIRFTVSDTGIGIAAENIDRIFEPFWQVEQTHVRRAGGTGLGLSVTRRLAQLLGGTVSVRSEPGVGSTFEVCLPRGR